MKQCAMLLLALAMTAGAQTRNPAKAMNASGGAKPAEAAKPAAAPVIGDAALKEYFKATSDLLGAEAALDRAQKAAQAAGAAVSQQVAAMRGTCGAFLLQLDAKGYPACVAAPEPAKK